MKVQLGREEYDLRGDGRRWWLRASDGDLLELSSDEYASLAQRQVSDRTLELSGFEIGEESELASAVASARSQFDDDQLAVLLDTTSARNALFALEGRAGPLHLIDLAALTHALVLYDVILMQPIPTLPAAAQAIVVPLHFSRQAIYNDLWAILVTERERHGRTEQELSVAWRKLLGWQEPLRLDLGAFDTYQDSPGYWDGVPATAYADLAMNRIPVERSSLETFLSIQTMRTFFNDRVAGLMRVPYLASSFRAPAMTEVIREKVVARAAVDRLFLALNPGSGAAGGDREGPFLSAVSAPLLLSIVLRRMEDRSVYWRVVEDLRVEFEGFRAVVRADRKALTGNSPAFLKRYAGHLRNAAVAPELAGSAAEAVGGVAAVAAPVGAFGAAVGIAAKLTAKFGIPTLRRGFDRLFRPDVYVLNSVADEARHLVELEEVIQRLWGQEWQRSDYETLERLSRSQPLAALQLGYPQ